MPTRDIISMTLRLASLLAAAALALSACSDGPAAAPAPTTTSSTATSTTSTAAPATSATSSNRSGLLVQVDEAAERAGVAPPEGMKSVSAYVVLFCDNLDEAEGDAQAQANIAWEWATYMGDGKSSPLPEADKVAALNVGVPIACPQHMKHVTNLNG